MIDEKQWNEFRDSGLLWWINMILHTFGWAIVYEINDNKDIVRVYPARVKYRGFSESSNTDGYKKVTKFIMDNATDLSDEANN